MKTMFFKPQKFMKNFIAIFLAFTLLFSLCSQIVWAAEDKNENEKMDELIKEHASGDYSYKDLATMWSNYFLDFLPNESQPEALKRLTVLPEYDNMDGRYGWNNYLHDGDRELMRNDIFFYADKLGATNSNLSLEEKANRISKWAYTTDYLDNSVMGRIGVFDGYTYDCTTTAEGLTSIFRLAGIPAINISLKLYGVSHEESFFFLNGTWYNAITEEAFTDYFSRVYRDYVTDVCTYGYAAAYLVDENINPILDLSKTWVDEKAERFILQLLRQPYAYPEKKLTRGEVAKILCNFIGTVPMKNDQIFSDVQVSHDYSSYIWVMNKLGIMGGIGDNKFNPDAELTIQEFAVMAMRVLEYRNEEIAKQSADELKEIESNPTDWPPDLQYTQDVVRRLKEKVDWKTRIANISSSTPIVFADNAKIASWAKPAVDEFSKFGILQGNSADSNSRLNPTEALSKTRFLVFMFKFEEKLKLFNEFTPTPIF